MYNILFFQIISNKLKKVSTGNYMMKVYINILYIQCNYKNNYKDIKYNVINCLEEILIFCA